MRHNQRTNPDKEWSRVWDRNQPISHLLKTWLRKWTLFPGYLDMTTLFRNEMNTGDCERFACGSECAFNENANNFYWIFINYAIYAELGFKSNFNAICFNNMRFYRNLIPYLLRIRRHTVKCASANCAITTRTNKPSSWP